jgi:3-oxoacyl-[acyl-carrier-protein] synthase II
MSRSRRVVITGLGVASTAGASVDEFWRNCLDGHGNIDMIPDAWRDYASYKSGIWAPLPEIDYGPLNLSVAERTQRDPSTLLALHAASAAVDDAGLDREKISEKDNTFLLKDVDRYRAAVIVGTGIGGIHTVIQQHTHHICAEPRKTLQQIAEHEVPDTAQRLLRIADGFRVPSRFSPFAVSMVMPNAVSATIGIKFSLGGQNNTVCEACSAGTAAIGQAFESVRQGRCDLAITGGVEYIGDEYGTVFHAFDAGGVLVRNTGDPARANRPFDADRTGMLLAEGGAGLLVIEELEHARCRGATIYAEICGYGETFDAYSLMMIEPSGEAIKRAHRQALDTAGIDVSEVDYINAHGTGTRSNDVAESSVIGEVFSNRVLVNSSKSILGHSLGASGALEAIVCALSLKHQMTHACRNLDNPIADLNFVREVRSYPINVALSQSLAFGGHNSVLVMRQWQG